MHTGKCDGKGDASAHLPQGKLVYQLPDIQQIRSHCKQQVDTLWDEVKRFENPHNYYVDLSQKLWDIKNDLLAGLQQHLN